VSRRAIAYWVFALVVAALFAYLTFGYTTYNPILDDGAQNTRSAYHLVHAGVISRDQQESETPKPQMRREPLPIVVTAGFLLLHPAFSQPYRIVDLLDGRLTKTVKGVNAFWRFLLAIFLFLLCLELFPDRRVAAGMGLICLIISESFFLSRPGIVDRLYTELPEVALMLLASWSAVRFVRTKTKSRALWLGVALGLLALCKASFLYIGVGFILLLLVTDRAQHFRPRPGKAAWRDLVLTYAIIALAMFATIAPWIARNAVVFGNPQIAAGTDVSVLGIRLLLMEQPLLGQLYLYSPDAFKKRLVGPLTGYGPEDLKPGGRLEGAAKVKLNRGAIFAERIKGEGYQGEQSSWVKSKFFNYVVEHPLRYIASIGVFGYEAMWFMPRAGSFNLVALLCFFGIFFGALFTRDQVMLAAFGLPVGLFFFIAIFTHGLTRYTSPMTPFVILSVLWLLAASARQAYRRFAHFRALVDPCLRLIQRPSDANSSSQRRPTTPTSSAETASRA
jgi:hypothetical protein